MKILLIKTALWIGLLLASLFANAQGKVDEMYYSFEGKDGFTVIGFSNNSLIKDISAIIDNQWEDIIHDVDRFKVLNYNENNGDLSANEVFKRVTKTFSRGEYFEIPSESLSPSARIKVYSDSIDDEVELFGRGSEDEMSEFHIVTRSEGSVCLFSFWGNLSIDEIEDCVSFKKRVVTTY